MQKEGKLLKKNYCDFVAYGRGLLKSKFGHLMAWKWVW